MPVTVLGNLPLRETITEGEIVACLPIPPSPQDHRRGEAALQRRNGPLPRRDFVAPVSREIISRELHIPYSEIEMDKTGSYIITGETKVGGNLVMYDLDCHIGGGPAGGERRHRRGYTGGRKKR